jgi:hypothetical protein
MDKVPAPGATKLEPMGFNVGEFDPKAALEAIVRDAMAPAIAKVQAIRVWLSIDAREPATKKEKALQSLNERVFAYRARVPT